MIVLISEHDGKNTRTFTSFDELKNWMRSPDMIYTEKGYSLHKKAIFFKVDGGEWEVFRTNVFSAENDACVYSRFKKLVGIIEEDLRADKVEH